MRRRLFYYWRLFGTFLSFSSFGLGGLVSGITIFPVIYLLPVSRAWKIYLSRSFVRLMFKFFIGFMAFMGVLTYEIHGKEKLRRKGLLVIANHPTLIDVVFLISLANRPNCVVKNGVWKNPFMYFVVKASGFIQNGNNSDELVEKCVETLNNGDGLIIFPEGTRTNQAKQMHLKRGVAHIALQAKKSFTPVIIRCNPITLTKSHRWYHIPESRPPHFSIYVEEDVTLQQGCEDVYIKAITARKMTENMYQFFAQKMDLYGQPRN